MLFAGIGLLDERGQYRENQFLGVRGKKIEYIGGSRCPLDCLAGNLV